MCLTRCEELSEEDAEAGDLDGVDEEDGPDQGPVSVVEQCFTNAVGSCVGARHDYHAQSGDQTDKDNVDDHGSSDPDQVVDPCTKTIDA